MKRSAQPAVAITFEETERRGITNRLKMPMLAAAIALEYDDLAPWLEGQVLVEAWQFIELGPDALRARLSRCGPFRLGSMNSILLALRLPHIGIPLCDQLIKRHLGRRNEHHPPSALRTEYYDRDSDDPDVKAALRDSDERAMISVIHRAQDDYLRQRDRLNDIFVTITSHDSNERKRLEREITKLVHAYMAKFIAGGDVTA